jgi:O-antigen ligase
LKWAALFLAIALAVPLGLVLRGRMKVLAVVAGLIGFLPFFGLDHVDINVLSFKTYRGDSRGFELTLVDVLAVAMFFALPTRASAPYLVPRLLYLGAVVVSIKDAPLPLFSLFSVWKLVRMYVFFAAMVRLATRPRLASALLSGMGLGIVFSLLLALGQRYFYGAMRPMAAFSHPNSLAMAANLVFPIALAIVLSAPRAKIAIAAAMTAPLCVVLTLSRGALVLTVLEICAVLGVSILRRPTARKGLVAASIGVMGLAVVVKSYDTLIERFTRAPPQSEQARTLFNQAARAMLSDHPFGVGINQYSHVLGNLGYADALGIPPIDREGLAHHVYWLTAAETGWLGVSSYLLLLALPLFAALSLLRAKGMRGDLALGCAVSLGVMYVHGTAEWIARQTAMSYMFWSVAALCVGLVRTAPGGVSDCRETR